MFETAAVKICAERIYIIGYIGFRQSHNSDQKTKWNKFTCLFES